MNPARPRRPRKAIPSNHHGKGSRLTHAHMHQGKKSFQRRSEADAWAADLEYWLGIPHNAYECRWGNRAKDGERFRVHFHAGRRGTKR